jgi:hypothetical protein
MTPPAADADVLPDLQAGRVEIWGRASVCGSSRFILTRSLLMPIHFEGRGHRIISPTFAQRNGGDNVDFEHGAFFK